MPTYEVEMVLSRTVTVTVEASNETEAQENALDRSRWITARGLRSRLKLLVTLDTRRLDDPR